MLTPAQVVPFLRHERPAVRDAAVRYLTRAHDPAAATADDFWRAADALGPQTYGGRETALRAIDMPQTGYSVGRTLEAIEAADATDAGAELFRLRLLVGLRYMEYEPLDPCPCGSGKTYKKCCGGSWGRAVAFRWDGEAPSEPRGHPRAVEKRLGRSLALPSRHGSSAPGSASRSQPGRRVSVSGRPRRARLAPDLRAERLQIRDPHD